MSTESVIREIVDEWTTQGKMFTAFEVSIASKSKGVTERHRDIRDDVHEIIFEIGQTKNYTRILMDVGAPIQAWVYYKQGDNPYSYQPLNASKGNVAPPLLVAPSTLTPTSNLALIPADAFGTDNRGRLTIPVKLLTDINVKPKERVNVVAMQDKLLVRKRVEPTIQLTTDPVEESDKTTVYTAEPDGNIRITQHTLNKATIAGLPYYTIKNIGDGTIEVSK